MKLKLDLRELENEGIIGSDTSKAIADFYARKNSGQPNRLLLAFGILGALLISLGIILIIAHNWDQFPTSIKTSFAFLPLVLGQGIAIFTMWKKNENRIWREGAGTFLFFAVAASIALVAQVYHLPGNTASFLLTWLLLTFPLIYLLQSSFVSLFYILILTYYSSINAFESSFDYNAFLYYALLLLVLPHYIFLARNKAGSNVFLWHNYFLPLSLLISLHIVEGSWEEFMFLVYAGLFSVFYLFGASGIFGKESNVLSYRLLGSLGLVITLLVGSFEYMWSDVHGRSWSEVNYEGSDFMAVIFLFFTWLILLRTKLKNNKIRGFDIMDWTFPATMLLFALGTYNGVLAMWLVNLFLLGLGISIVIRASKENNLARMNYGLLIIAALVAIRFFDENLSFVVRGLLFLAAGAGFFLANIRMIKKRRQHE